MIADVDFVLQKKQCLVYIKVPTYTGDGKNQKKKNLQDKILKINMAKQPKTTSEHLISIYGYITGLKREVSSIKNNHLKHLHQDIEGLHTKVDRILYAILGGLGATILTLLGLFT